MQQIFPLILGLVRLTAASFIASEVTDTIGLDDTRNMTGYLSVAYFVNWVSPISETQHCYATKLIEKIDDRQFTVADFTLWTFLPRN